MFLRSRMPQSSIGGKPTRDQQRWAPFFEGGFSSLALICVLLRQSRHPVPARKGRSALTARALALLRPCPFVAQAQHGRVCPAPPRGRDTDLPSWSGDATESRVLEISRIRILLAGR